MATKGSTAEDVLKDLTKKYGPIGTVSEVLEETVGLPTGNLAIDYLTGCGGLPVGRVVELYGQASSGKTTTALQAAALLQQRILAEASSDRILYLDFEHALDPDYCGALGLDVEHPSFIVAQPDWLEDGAEIGERLIKTGQVRLSIWDSVAEMTPKELEFGVRTNAMERARLMNSLLQRHNSLLHAHRCAGVFLNHMTEAIQMGGRPGMPPAETSPGGKSLKFYASLRLAYKQISTKKGAAPDALTGSVTEQTIATYVKVRATKNKIGIPHREAIVRVRYGQGFDNVWTALQVLLDHKLIRKDGAWYRFDGILTHVDMSTPGTGKPSLHGEAAVFAFADAHADWATLLIDTAAKVIESFAGALAPATNLDLDDLGPDLDLDELL